MSFPGPPRLPCIPLSFPSPPSLALSTSTPVPATFPTWAQRGPSFAQPTPSLLPLLDDNAHFLGSLVPSSLAGRQPCLAPDKAPIYVYFFVLVLRTKRSRPFSRRGARFLSLFYNSPPPFFPLTFSLPICLFGPRLRASSRIHSTLGGILSLFSPSPRVSFLHATRRNSLRLALSGCRVLA